MILVRVLGLSRDGAERYGTSDALFHGHTSPHLRANAASAFPSIAQTAVYWDQNGGGVRENNDLGAYCTSASGINIIVLAFLYEYGNGINVALGITG